MLKGGPIAEHTTCGTRGLGGDVGLCARAGRGMAAAHGGARPCVYVAFPKQVWHEHNTHSCTPPAEWALSPFL